MKKLYLRESFTVGSFMLLNACQHFNETKNSYVQTNSTTFTKNTSEKTGV